MNYNTLIADALAYLRGAPVTLAGDKLIQTRQAADMIERALTNDQQTAVPVGWVRVRGTPDDPDPEFHFSDTPPAYAYNAHTSFDGWFPVYRQSPKSFIWKAEAERLINGIVEARRQIRNAMDRSPDSASKVAFTRALTMLPSETPGPSETTCDDEGCPHYGTPHVHVGHDTIDDRPNTITNLRHDIRTALDHWDKHGPNGNYRMVHYAVLERWLQCLNSTNSTVEASNDKTPRSWPDAKLKALKEWREGVEQPSALDRIADALERIASRPIAKSIIDHPGWPTPLPGEQGWRPSKEWREGFLAGHFKASQETCPHSRRSTDPREWIKGHTAAV